MQKFLAVLGKKRRKGAVVILQLSTRLSGGALARIVTDLNNLVK